MKYEKWRGRERETLIDFKECNYGSQGLPNLLDGLRTR